MTSKKWADLPTRFVSASGPINCICHRTNSWTYWYSNFWIRGCCGNAMGVGANVWSVWPEIICCDGCCGLGWLPMIVQPLILYAGMTLPSVAGFLPILIGAALVKSQRGIYICYGAFVTLGMVSFWYLALNFGSFGIGILAALVVLSDVGGYVAGRIIGGVKFWPSISPKKTWSGTIAGWILTALLGFFLVQSSGEEWMVAVAGCCGFWCTIRGYRRELD